jgi:hypothetical protein
LQAAFANLNQKGPPKQPLITDLVLDVSRASLTSITG